MIGFWIHRKGFKNIREWALEKTPFGNFVLIMTLFATTYSSFTFVGMPGYFYTHGIGTAWIVCFPAIVFLPIIMYVVGRKVIELNASRSVVTPFELLKDRILGKHARMALGILFLAMFLFNLPYTVIQIAGIGKVLNALSEGAISYPIAAFVVLVVIFIYASLGGLKGVIITDVVQGVFGIIMMLLLAAFFVGDKWGGLGEMFAQIQQKSPEHLKLPGPEGLMTHWFVIAKTLSIALISLTYIQLFSRLLLIRNNKDLKKIAMGFSAASLLIGVITLVIGLGAVVAYPAIAGDLTIVEVIKDSPLTRVLGSALGALFFVAVLAGAMSTADSVLFALGSVFCRDFLGTVCGKADLSEKQQKFYMKGFMVFFLILCYVIALNPPKLIIDFALSSIAGLAVMFPALASLLWKKLEGLSLIISIILGYLVFMICEILEITAMLPAIATSSLSLLICYFVIDKRLARQRSNF